MNLKKSKNQILELYFKSLEYEESLQGIQELFADLDIDVESFEEYCKTELEELEKTIITNYHLQNKSLKNIAEELELSYSYVRKIYLEGKEKMRIILSIHTKKDNNEEKNKKK